MKIQLPNISIKEFIIKEFGNQDIGKKCCYCNSKNHRISQCNHPDIKIIKNNILRTLYMLSYEEHYIILKTLKKNMLQVICAKLYISPIGTKKILIDKIVFFINWLRTRNENNMKINLINISIMDEEELNKTTDCLICLEEYKINEILKTRCCKQNFCEKCIKKQLQLDEEKKCPVCRISINEMDKFCIVL